MKKIIIIAVLITSLGLIKTNAQAYKTALGIRLSSHGPVVNHAGTFKYFPSERTAIEALFSFSDPVAIGGLLEVHKPLAATDGLQWLSGGGADIGWDGG